MRCVTNSNSRRKLEQGYIALMSVLITSAVALSITVALILLGIGSSRSSFAIEQSSEAISLADSCADEALRQIRRDDAFIGTHGITLGTGSCEYTIIDLGSENREIDSTGTVGSIVRKSKIIIDAIHPKINITSWQEVADF